MQYIYNYKCELRLAWLIYNMVGIAVFTGKAIFIRRTFSNKAHRLHRGRYMAAEEGRQAKNPRNYGQGASMVN